MGFGEIIGIAMGLSIDCLAISAGIGASRCSRWLAAFTSFAFGLFQAGLALAGMIGGQRLEGLLHSPAKLAAPVLVGAIGLVMITKGLKGAHTTLGLVGIVTILGLAVSTSLDALGTGIALGLLDIVSVTDAVVIGLVSILMSAVGFAGGRTLAKYTGVAEDIGGAVLIVIAAVMLLSLR
ncbi:MAG TPA: manganese efflux pump [bacterium]|nr:manganese efflux pump [bacterium]